MRQKTLRFVFALATTLGVGATLPGCAPEKPLPTDDEMAEDGFGSVQAALRAPENFQDDFCVRIEAAGDDYSPAIFSEDVYSAGTVVIETVLANIPVGTDRTVSLGIFSDGECNEDLESANWYGSTGGVEINEGEVTIVNIDLNASAGGGGNTGSVVIRTTTQSTRRLHAEIVDAQSNPIPAATCRVYDGSNLLGVASSGSSAVDFGVVDVDINAPPSVETLTLRCSRANLVGVADAEFDVDPNDPSLGTFTSTVILESAVQLVESTEERLIFRVAVGSLAMTETAVDGQSFRRFGSNELPGQLAPLSTQEFVGFPEVPVFSTFIALPMGVDSPDDVAIRAEGDSREINDVLLYPIQPHSRAPAAKGEEEPSDDYPEDANPFMFDRDVYLKGQFDVGDILEMRQFAHPDVNLLNISFPVVSYDPTQAFLSIPESVLVEVALPRTDDNCFRFVAQLADDSRFEEDAVERLVARQDAPLIESLAVNSNLVAQRICPQIFTPVFLGARLVIVADDDFLPAANDLAAHKRSIGISTVVVPTSSIQSGNAVSKQDIRSYMLEALFDWAVKPKWLLLMGDAEYIPTHYGAANSYDDADNAGDQYYGQLIVADTVLPLFGIGRLPVDTNAQAQTIVDKIKAFETSPPTGLLNSFYDQPVFAAQFQDDDNDGQAERWFAETSEHIRDYLLTQDITPLRIYKAPSASNPTWWQGGGVIPWYLRKPTFPWDGSTADVIDAVNAGTSILYHRDHGWWSGWGSPGFSTSSLSSIAITNNEFPVVFSINCASGIFDNETDNASYGTSNGFVSWSETFLRKADGALAIIGDTRSSSTVLNNDMAKGLFDATFPGYLGYGNNTVKRRVGDVLNHAKGYLHTRGYSAASLGQELTIYNVLGDPTVEIKTRPPINIGLEIPVLTRELIEFEVTCETCPPLDELVAVLHYLDDNGNPAEVIARGVVGADGRASFELDDAVDGQVGLTVSGPDAAPVKVELEF